MNFTEQEANLLALKTGRSIAILRQHLSKNNKLHPKWIKDIKVVKKLIPFTLCGSWVKNRKFEKDLKTLMEIGNLDKQELDKDFDTLSGLEQSPVDKFVNLEGKIFMVTSQFDALFKSGPAISLEQIDRFFKTAKSFFCENDSMLDFPVGNSWDTEFYNTSNKYSKYISKGICEAFCILAVYGNAICGTRLRVNIQEKTNNLVKQILTNANSERWLSFRYYLEYFAEASPDVFLDCLKADLSTKSPEIKALMNSTPGSISGICLRRELLWALEKLAWHKQYFARVIDVLFELQKYDQEDNWPNSAQNSLNSLFRSWLPSTELAINERFKVLQNKVDVNQKIVIDICISLLPKKYALSGTRTSSPKWRPIGKSTKPTTESDIQKSYELTKKIILGMEQYDSLEIQLLVENMIDLGDEHFKKLVNIVKNWAKIEVDDEQREKVCQSLRKNITKIKFLKIENKVEYWKAIDEMQTSIQPKSKIFEHKWLFDKQHIDWTLLVDRNVEKRPEMQVHENLLQVSRVKAIEEIFSEGGEDAILALILKVNNSRNVAQSLLPYGTAVENRVHWIEKLITKSFEHAKAAKWFIYQALLDTDSEGIEIAQIVNLLNKKNIFKLDDKNNLFIRALPPEPKGWNILTEIEKSAEKIYWEGVELLPDLQLSIEEVEFAVNKLIQFDRSVEAFALAGPYHDKIHSSIWKNILECVKRSKKISNLAYDNFYYLNEVFRYLDEDQNISVQEIAELEFPFLIDSSVAERLSDDRVLACHRLIIDDLDYLFDLLVLCHKRDDGVLDKSSLGIPKDEIDNHTKIAYQILRSWTRVPGELDNGKIVRKHFEGWINEAYKKAKESALLNALKHYLPRIFAKFVCKIPSELTLPEVILEVLNQDEDSTLRDKFWMEIVNFSGVFLGDLFVGGLRQREIAEKYKVLASKIEPKYPRVSESLKIGANQLVKEAEYEDDRLKSR